MSVDLVEIANIIMAHMKEQPYEIVCSECDATLEFSCDVDLDLELKMSVSPCSCTTSTGESE